MHGFSKVKYRLKNTIEVGMIFDNPMLDNIENKDYRIQIKFYEKSRENKKFDNFEELKNQILEDINLAKNYFINIY